MCFFPPLHTAQRCISGFPWFAQSFDACPIAAQKPHRAVFRQCLAVCLYDWQWKHWTTWQSPQKTSQSCSSLSKSRPWSMSMLACSGVATPIWRGATLLPSLIVFLAQANRTISTWPWSFGFWAIIPLIASSFLAGSIAATRIPWAMTVYSRVLTLAVLPKVYMISGLLAQRSLFCWSLKVTIISPLGSLYAVTMLRSWSLALMSYIMSSPKRCFCYGSLLPGAMMISLA